MEALAPALLNAPDQAHTIKSPWAHVKKKLQAGISLKIVSYHIERLPVTITATCISLILPRLYHYSSEFATFRFFHDLQLSFFLSINNLKVWKIAARLAGPATGLVRLQLIDST